MQTNYTRTFGGHNENQRNKSSRLMWSSCILTDFFMIISKNRRKTYFKPYEKYFGGHSENQREQIIRTYGVKSMFSRFSLSFCDLKCFFDVFKKSIFDVYLLIPSGVKKSVCFGWS